MGGGRFHVGWLRFHNWAVTSWDPCLLLFLEGFFHPVINIYRAYDYFISHEIRIPINQPGFNGMSTGFWTWLNCSSSTEEKNEPFLNCLQKDDSFFRWRGDIKRTQFGHLVLQEGGQMLAKLDQLIAIIPCPGWKRYPTLSPRNWKRRKHRWLGIVQLIHELLRCLDNSKTMGFENCLFCTLSPWDSWSSWFDTCHFQFESLRFLEIHMFFSFRKVVLSKELLPSASRVQRVAASLGQQLAMRGSRPGMILQVPCQCHPPRQEIWPNKKGLLRDGGG